MTFGAPWALWLLALVALLPLQPRLTGRRRLLLPGPDAHTTRRTLRSSLARLPLILRMVGLAALVVALARPQDARHHTRLSSDGLDILLAVDTSGSMRANDFSHGTRQLNRLDVAKAVMDHFIERRPADRIGIVVFGEEAFTHIPLTLDHETLRNVLRTIQIGTAGERRTAIGSAIAVGSKRLKDLDAPSKVLILLTDGQNNAGRISPAEAAKLAAALNIRVYTIGIGSAQVQMGGLFGGSSDAVDEDTLREVSQRTGARYFRATDSRTLERVFEAIDTLEPSPGQSEDVVDVSERYHAWLALALIALVLDQLLSATWLRIGP